MLEFYKEQLEFLKAQHKFEKISAEIAEFRFQRTQFELAFANLVSESSKKEDTTKEK